jgi:hypothetical protein
MHPQRSTTVANGGSLVARFGAQHVCDASWLMCCGFEQPSVPAAMLVALVLALQVFLRRGIVVTSP